MKLLVLCSLLFASASGALVTSAVTSAFQGFVSKYGKSYSEHEFGVRLAVFAENLEMVNKLNAEHILQGGDAVFGITKFMDLTTEEFTQRYLNYQPGSNEGVKKEVPNAFGALADSVDWRTKDVITPVKDQGQCGSCWAFSVVEAIESYAKLAGKDLVELSTQQVTSCDKLSFGCNGGTSQRGFNYVKRAGGIELEESYPYKSGTSGQTGTCNADKSKFVLAIAGHTAVASGEKNLKTALNSGPVSVCLAATKFQTYTGGVLKTCDNNVNHCVQGVGYDDTDETPYWLIRNSWAEDWGEKGYIRLAQGSDLCKVSDDVSYPTF